jgi:hypothetical protein
LIMRISGKARIKDWMLGALAHTVYRLWPLQTLKGL